MKFSIINPFSGDKYTSYFSTESVESKYNKSVLSTDTEDIFFKDNQCVIVLKDEIIRRRIYNLVNKIKKWRFAITYGEFCIKKIVTNLERDEVFAIYMDYDINEAILKLDKIKKVQEIIYLIKKLYSKGFYFSEANFNINSCRGICGILSNLQEGGDEKESDGCIIKLAHYIITDGKDFDEEYKKIEECGFANLTKLDYSLNTFKMFYDYYKDKILPDNILKNISKENLFNDGNSVDIEVVINDEMVTDKRENIIYHFYPRMDCYRFRDFSEEIEEINDYTDYSVKSIIISKHSNVIGYRYEKKSSKKIENISNMKFDFQKEIVSVFNKLYSFVYEIHEYCVSKVEKNVNIEDYIGYFYRNNNICFYFKGIDKIIEFFKMSEKCRVELVARLFLKIYSEYITRMYGEISTKDDFYEKQEIKILSPNVAKEVIDYISNQNLSEKKFVDEFEDFIQNCLISRSKNYAYYCKYRFDPEEVEISFDRQFEKIYNIDLSDNSKKIIELPNDKTFIRVDNMKMDINKLYKKQKDNLEIISKYFNEIKTSTTLITIKEIVYSQEFNKNKKTYDIVGYITDKVKGKMITDDFLLKMDNKRFSQLYVKLFSFFREKYIDLSNVYIDEDDKLYIDVASDSINFFNINGNNSFTDMKLDDLEKKGLDKTRFSDINFSGNSLYFNWLLSKMTTYCSKHNVYYDNLNSKCPVCWKIKYDVSDFFSNYRKVEYEDKYAKHYIVDDMYNLKMYKNDFIDLEKMEDIVENIVTNRRKNDIERFGQSHFIPVKIAYSNDKFVGYIYNRFDFNSSTCYNLSDLEKLKNYPRLKSCERLIIQLKELYDNDFTFSKNPFGSVFLSKDCLRQVQITNPEFIVPNKENDNNIEKYTIDYVRSVINSDKNIDINIDKNVDSWDSLLEDINNYANSLTKSCVHHGYYKGDYLCCPICFSPKVQENIKKCVVYIDENEINNWTQIDEGGESIIYRYKNGDYAKIFKKDEVKLDYKLQVIYKIISKKDVIETMNAETQIRQYVKPYLLLYSSTTRELLGYVMKVIKDSFDISILRDKIEVEKLGFTRKDIMEIVINIGIGVSQLHNRLNFFIGDFNGRKYII